MDKKLTVSLDKEVIEKAKQFVKRNNTSLSKMIEAYFGDGSEYGVNIKYYPESKPLGTIAPLKYISGEDLRFYMGLGAMTGVVAILIHSLTDFIPSNAAYFALLLAQ